MKEDYKRLLQAAKELRGWESPAEVSANLAKFGYSVSEQTMTNWKTRGVSKEGRLKASAIIGCRPLWIESATGQMVDTPLAMKSGQQVSGTDKAHHAEQPSSSYSPSIGRLLKRLAEAEATLPNFALVSATIEGILDIAFASAPPAGSTKSTKRPGLSAESSDFHPPVPKPTKTRS